MDPIELDDIINSIEGVAFTKPSNEYNSVYFEYVDKSVRLKLSLAYENGTYFLSDDGLMNLKKNDAENAVFSTYHPNELESIILLNDISETEITRKIKMYKKRSV